MQLVSALETPTALSDIPLQKTRLRLLPMRTEVCTIRMHRMLPGKYADQVRRSSNSLDPLIC